MQGSATYEHVPVWAISIISKLNYIKFTAIHDEEEEVENSHFLEDGTSRYLAFLL